MEKLNQTITKLSALMQIIEHRAFHTKNVGYLLPDEGNYKCSVYIDINSGNLLQSLTKPNNNVTAIINVHINEHILIILDSTNPHTLNIRTTLETKEVNSEYKIDLDIFAHIIALKHNLNGGYNYDYSSITISTDLNNIIKELVKYEIDDINKQILINIC